jgi:hypothetical protein
LGTTRTLILMGFNPVQGCRNSSKAAPRPLCGGLPLRKE